jgi:hypothetical protein
MNGFPQMWTSHKTQILCRWTGVHPDWFWPSFSGEALLLPSLGGLQKRFQPGKRRLKTGFDRF